MIVKVLLLIGLIVLGNVVSGWFVDRLDIALTPANEPYIHRALMVSMCIYIILMAIPFVPGMEIGLAVMMIFGSKIAVLVYVSTLIAFGLSFMVGRFIPERILIRFFHDLRLNRLSRLLAEVEGMSQRERIDFMFERVPTKIIPLLLRYRYLALVAAFNMPGNLVIGGGGGIAFVAGLSRMFSPALFALTTAVAISPLPLAWLLFGESVFT